MSSNLAAAWLHRAFLALLLLTTTSLAGCQVGPLYGQGSSAGESLGSIAFSEAEDRVSQEVRNHLIFLTGGGMGEAVNPQYTVDLKIRSQTVGVLLEQSSDVAKAGRVVVSADYTLSRASDAAILRAGHRKAVALVDFPAQEFAKLRAVRDAENRASRQLAELIRADLAAVLGR